MSYPEQNNPFFIKRFSFQDYIESYKNYTGSNNEDFWTRLYGFRKVAPMVKSYFRKVQPKEMALGSHAPLYRDKLKEDIEIRKNKKIEKNSIEKFPSISKYYIDRIIEYCNSNGIKLIFLSTPKYNVIWNDTIYREVHRRYYNDIPLWDDMTLEFPDSCYGDCLHLNYRGSTEYIRYIQSRLGNQ